MTQGGGEEAPYLAWKINQTLGVRRIENKIPKKMSYGKKFGAFQSSILFKCAYASLSLKHH